MCNGLAVSDPLDLPGELPAIIRPTGNQVRPGRLSEHTTPVYQGQAGPGSMLYKVNLVGACLQFATRDATTVVAIYKLTVSFT
jgi:hypothetical protein